jgi:hypothetical protein
MPRGPVASDGTFSTDVSLRSSPIVSVVLG